MSDKDAEIAREELAEREALWEMIDVYVNENDNGDTHPLVDAILAAGFSRQSPASTTAADAWDEGYNAFRQASLDISDNPYRVAAPEGDGGK